MFGAVVPTKAASAGPRENAAEQAPLSAVESADDASFGIELPLKFGPDLTARVQAVDVALHGA